MFSLESLFNPVILIAVAAALFLFGGFDLSGLDLGSFDLSGLFGS